MNFAYDYEINGEQRTIVLKPGGEDVLVTEKNKEEFIEYVTWTAIYPTIIQWCITLHSSICVISDRLMVQWRFRRGIENQTKAFLDGFNEIVPVNWLQFFDEKELELMLCGMQELDIDEWEKYTMYKGYDKESKQIKWFWQVNGDFNPRPFCCVVPSSRCISHSL